MIVKHLDPAQIFIAGDGSHLNELLHPVRDPSLPLTASIAYAEIPARERTLRHRLRTSTEVYHILTGCGMMYIDEEERWVVPGDTVLIPPNSWQSFANHGSEVLRFLCVVDPAWSKEDEEVEEQPELITATGTNDE